MTDPTLDECAGTALGITNNLDAFDLGMLRQMLSQHVRQVGVLNVGG